MATRPELLKEARSLGIETNKSMKSIELEQLINQKKLISGKEENNQKAEVPVATAPTQEAINTNPNNVPSIFEEQAKAGLTPKLDATNELVKSAAPVVIQPNALIVSQTNPLLSAPTVPSETAQVLKIEVDTQNAILEKLRLQSLDPAQTIQVYIEFEDHDYDDAVFPVTIGGVKVNIPKGKMVFVPKDVAAVYNNQRMQINNSQRRRRTIGSLM